MKVRVVLYPSEEGYAVSAPSLPGCWSQGATREEGLANIADAVREYLEAGRSGSRCTGKKSETPPPLFS
jgi:predicted RNase H-like HicB family nuclease